MDLRDSCPCFNRLPGEVSNTSSVLFYPVLEALSQDQLKHILPGMTGQGHESTGFLMPLLRFVRAEYSQG